MSSPSNLDTNTLGVPPPAIEDEAAPKGETDVDDCPITGDAIIDRDYTGKLYWYQADPEIHAAAELLNTMNDDERALFDAKYEIGEPCQIYPDKIHVRFHPSTTEGDHTMIRTIKVKSIARLDIKSGETLVVTMPTPTTRAEVEAVRDACRDNLPDGVRMLIKSDGIEFQVVAREDA